MLYKVARRNVPTASGREDRYYAVAVAAGRSTLEQIVAKIQARCTVTRPDILAVFAALLDDIEDRLQSGQIVEVGELGNFQLTVHNRGGSATEEEWTNDFIKNASIVFRPSVRFQRIAENTSFTRWQQSTPAGGTEESGGEP